MTRGQFLNDLYRRLRGMTPEQAEQHLTYYAEMLADRMEEGMTEAEAVASMEDVDTIARRIREEEGLPWPPPDPPVTPPEYPDASRLGGGGGTRGYQVPRRFPWRRAAQIALGAVAAVSVLAGLRSWALERDSRQYPREAVPVEAPAAVDDSPIAEDQGYESVWEGGGWESQGYEYDSGPMDFDGCEIRNLDIQWAVGTVRVESWSGDCVRVQEYARTELNERTALSAREENGTLTIRYRENMSRLGSVKDDKWLTVLVPDGMLAELSVGTAAANVELNGLEASSLAVSTASGDVTHTECYTDSARLSTVSGDLYLNGLYADGLELTTTSGDVWGDIQAGEGVISTISGDVSLSSMENTETLCLQTVSGEVSCYVYDNTLQSLRIGTTSGEVRLGLGYDAGFTLVYDTVSGDFLNSFGELSTEGRTYRYNGGGCEIRVETVSGNLEIS